MGTLRWKSMEEKTCVKQIWLLLAEALWSRLQKRHQFFMPNRLISWNAETSNGNPTKSIEVNDLIKSRVKKQEVQKQGRDL